jgi:DNA polymerase V
MYALVDCNNFYASCERLFNPSLDKRPIVVLSNNDGCVIARSDEAKAIGIVMGSPVFMMGEVIRKNRVAVFSSNYTLYGDLSDRVMQTINAFVPAMEIYSIDEAFLDMSGLGGQNLLVLGETIRHRVKKNIGIPVSVGIAPTKTLAKMANRYAKKHHKPAGVFWAADDELIREMLAHPGVKDVWGIGHQYSLFLQKHGFKTALDLANAPEEWVRKNMSVVGQRLLNELKGIPCLLSLYKARPKKNICTSRSFGNLLTDKEEIKVAVANYAALCASKLRQQKTCCKKLEVFIQTNPHKIAHKQYFMSIVINLETASNNAGEIIKYAMKGFDIIFKEGYRYLKCGVIVMDLVPENVFQGSIFSSTNTKTKMMMDTMDKLNKGLGAELVRTASQGFERRYKLKAEFLSPCYTTKLQEILKVKI